MRRQLSAVIVSTFVFSTPVLAQQDWVRDLLLAAQLPIVALDARNEGIPDNEISAILDAIRRNGLPAREATLILDTVRVVRRDHGPTDNFGAFVQSQLAAGKRGTDLAAAIRAEHARMGKGRGNGKPRMDDADRRGRDDDASGRRENEARGRSGSAGRPPAEAPSRGQSRGNRGRGGPPSR